MTTKSTVSRRYAEGLFVAANAADMLDKVGEELHMIYQLIETISELKAVFYHPKVSKEEKKRLLDQFFSSEVSHLTFNLMNLLIEKKRMEILPELLDEYGKLVREERQELIAHVQVARPLSPEANIRLADSLLERTGKKVILNVKINPELIGGITVEIDGRILDGSIKGSLDRVKENISAMGPLWSEGIEVNKGNEVTT